MKTIDIINMKIVDIIKKTFCLQDKSMWINVCGLVVDNKSHFTIRVLKKELVKIKMLLSSLCKDKIRRYAFSD
ncbi:MAG: hypothetical protein HQK62_01400 [Desulfamplus sp.]|nr:hypothetical protein [Desulfamplus sp.]